MRGGSGAQAPAPQGAGVYLITILILRSFSCRLKFFDMISFNKVILSGNMVEVFDYERAVNYLSEIEASKLWRGSSRVVNFKRVVACNLYDWRAVGSKQNFAIFVTLTFRDNDIIDTHTARQSYELFQRKFTKFLMANGVPVVRYSAVQEFTKRGQPHFHILYYNVPYVSDLFNVLKDFWVFGYSLFKLVVDDGVSGYMAKYLTKSSSASISHSKSVLFPRVLFGSEATYFLRSLGLGVTQLPVYTTDYYSMRTRSTLYTKYVLPSHLLAYAHSFCGDL